jgi:hypothetical protein
MMHWMLVDFMFTTLIAAYSPLLKGATWAAPRLAGVSDERRITSQLGWNPSCTKAYVGEATTSPANAAQAMRTAVKRMSSQVFMRRLY